MSSIHERIEEVLAAAVHDELSDAERYALHVHLVECAECRSLHKEDQLMNRALEEVFTQEKPDFGFEKRLLYAFRHRAPHREAFTVVWGNLLRSRAVHIAGAAALLLSLVQVGRLLTSDSTAPTDLTQRQTLSSLSEKKNGSAQNGSSFGKPVPAAPAEMETSAQAAADAVKSISTSPSTEIKEKLADAKGDVSAGALASSEAAPATTALTNAPDPGPVAAVAGANRKLIRNAQVDLEVANFEETFQRIGALISDGGGYVATSSSEKQENGKLRGRVVVKVLPERLEAFLEQLRSLGDLKNQTLGTEDVTKQYIDSEAQLNNARAMEERLLEILKKKSEDINDLLAVEKELGRVREQIERMQGELKLIDSQVQFATVTIALAEKDMDVPAGFLLKERAQLALFAADVEKVYNELKTFASPSVQITRATLERDSSGRVSALIRMLIAPEESESVLTKAKAKARVANFQTQTERIARGGHGMSEEAKTERDKVELDITISPEEQEPALQQTTLSIRTNNVIESVKQLRALVEKQNGRLQSSSFSRDPNGREYSNVSLRVPMKNYGAFMKVIGSLGKAENVTVHRQERADAPRDEANAPAELTMQVYSPGNIVANQTGVAATLRRTLAQGSAALMWSVQMIGVALAFFVPWILPIVLGIWVTRRILQVRAAKRDRT